MFFKNKKKRGKFYWQSNVYSKERKNFLYFFFCLFFKCLFLYATWMFRQAAFQQRGYKVFAENYVFSFNFFFCFFSLRLIRKENKLRWTPYEYGTAIQYKTCFQFCRVPTHLTKFNIIIKMMNKKKLIYIYITIKLQT